MLYPTGDGLPSPIVFRVPHNFSIYLAQGE